MNDKTPERLPDLDFQPELAPKEDLPIPQIPDEAWCEMASVMFAGRGYQTLVYADHYLSANVAPDGSLIPNSYNISEVVDYDGDPESHSFVGYLEGFEMLPDLRAAVTDSVQRDAFAKLSFAADLEAGETISRSAEHHILVPLSQSTELMLESM